MQPTRDRTQLSRRFQGQCTVFGSQPGILRLSSTASRCHSQLDRSRVPVNGVGCQIRSSMPLQPNFSANAALWTLLAHDIGECLGHAAALTSMALRNLCSRIGQQKSPLLQPFVEGRRWQSSPTVFDKL